jgi:hypothetical protein
VRWGQCGQPGGVLEVKRNGQIAAQQLARIHAEPVEVFRSQHAAGVFVDEAGQSHADAQRLPGGHRFE